MATPVTEQIHPFLWLKTRERYLALMVSAGHTAADRGDGGDQTVPLTPKDILFAGLDPMLTREYIRALSLSFMQTYIGAHSVYKKYLSADYANSISREPIPLGLVRSLTPTQLEQAYGNPPPQIFFPAPLRRNHQD